jgi:hypothetical protein
MAPFQSFLVSSVEDMEASQIWRYLNSNKKSPADLNLILKKTSLSSNFLWKFRNATGQSRLQTWPERPT